MTTQEDLKYILIVNVYNNDNPNEYARWYYFATKAELFRAWQDTDGSTMWEEVNGKLIRLVC